jgi:hypothetical protein
VKVGEHYYGIFVYLQMPGLRNALGAHHFYKIAIPFGKLRGILVR